MGPSLRHLPRPTIVLNRSVMQVRLQVVQENANLKQVKLLPVTVIGRSADCQLKIASTDVSRKHCRITITEREVLIEDLNSSNGTLVNQQRIAPSKPIAVAPGTKLQIGPATFVVDFTPPVTLETMPTTMLKSADVAALAGAPVVTSEPLAKFPIPPSREEEPAPPTTHFTDSPTAPPPSAEETVNVLGADETIRTQTPAPAAKLDESIAGNRTQTPPPSIPVAKPAVAKGTPVGKPVAKAVVAKAAPVIVSAEPVPPELAAEQTISTAAPVEEHVPPPKEPSSDGFDFLNSGEASANEPTLFDFNFAAPMPENAVPTATAAPSNMAKGAPDKKPVFGLFGKKKPTGSPPSAASAAEPSPNASSAKEVQPIAIPDTDSAESPAEESPAAAEPSAAAEPANPADPFGFLNGM